MNKDLSQGIAQMLNDSRYLSGKSQEYVADILGVSKKSVSNWENGTSMPNLEYALKWFDAIGIPMYPYLIKLIYPIELGDLGANSSNEKCRESLHKYVDELDDFHVREMLYILYGDHGSSSTGTLDLITAYLHLDLCTRVVIAEMITSHYKLAQELGCIKNAEHIHPDLKSLEKCLNTARGAVINGKQSYTLLED